jgi:hypothetical protein
MQKTTSNSFFGITLMYIILPKEILVSFPIGHIGKCIDFKTHEFIQPIQGKKKQINVKWKLEKIHSPEVMET